MTRLLSSTIMLIALTGGSVLPAAETKPTAPAAKPAAKSGLAGEYSGTWKAKDDSTGALRLKFRQEAGAGWVAEATFTLRGSEVPTKTKELVVIGSKLELTISWQAEGTAAQTKLTGALNGDVLEGTYDSTISEATASGTWRVTRS